MKKVKKFLLGNIKTVIAFILGVAISGGTVYAATIIYNSNQVGYDNTSSGMSATNVQDALDELYTKANSDNFWLKKYKTWAGTPTNYIHNGTNVPTSSSPTTPPSGKNVYLGLYADDQYGVCIKKNGTQHCFRYNNWIAESKHIQEVFSDVSCGVYSSYVRCGTTSTNVSCTVNSSGRVSCEAYGTSGGTCFVDRNGSVSCK